MKIKPKDWDWVRFAIKNRHRFKFTGSEPVVYDSGGNTNGIVAFKTIDATGKWVKTKHPQLAANLHNVKSSVNLHLKMWKEGIKDHTFTGAEMRAYLTSIGAPDWVIDAVNKTVIDEWNRQLIEFNQKQ